MYLLKELLVTLKKVIRAYNKFENCGLVKITGPEPSRLLQPPIQRIRQSLDELDNICNNLFTLSQKAEVFKEQVSHTVSETYSSFLI